MKHLSLR